MVYMPPPKMNTAYMIAAIVSMANVGVLVVALRNHRLSENDNDDEFFFNLLVMPYTPLIMVLSTSLPLVQLMNFSETKNKTAA